MPLAVGWSLPEAGLRGCLRQRQSPLAHASPAEGCGALPHGCTPRVLPSKLHSRGPTLASARPRNTSSTPQAASKQRVQVVSNRGSQPEPGGSEAAELDARIFALLIPAMLAVFLDPAMAVVDAGMTPRPGPSARDLHATCTPSGVRKTPVLCAGYSLRPWVCMCSNSREPGHTAAWSGGPEQPCILLLYRAVFLSAGSDHPEGGCSHGRESWWRGGPLQLLSNADMYTATICPELCSCVEHASWPACPSLMPGAFACSATTSQLQSLMPSVLGCTGIGRDWARSVGGLHQWAVRGCGALECCTLALPLWCALHLD